MTKKVDIWKKARECAVVPGTHVLNEANYSGLFNIRDIQTATTPHGNGIYPLAGIDFEGYVYPMGWVGWKYGSKEDDPEHVIIRVLFR